MDPTERFIPADEVASQMGAGVDPANQALMQALSQIRQTQAQPLMTQDPLGQLGVALQGAYSASRGEQNPAVSQALAVRQQQMRGFGEQANIASQINQMQMQQLQLAETRRARAIQEQAEARKSEHEKSLLAAEAQKTEVEKRKLLIGVAQGFLKSGAPQAMMEGGRIVVGELGKAGYTVSPEAATSLATAPPSKEQLAQISALLADGVPVDHIAKQMPTVNREIVQLIATAVAKGDDFTLETWGLPTRTAIKTKQVELQLAQQKLMNAQNEGTTAKEGTVTALRHEFGAWSKNFVGTKEAFQSVQELAKSATTMGDMALIFSFLKVLDPTSTVRESEFAAVGQSGSLPARAQNMFDKLMGQGLLQASQRADIVNQSRATFATRIKNQLSLESEYTRIAGERGVPPKSVIVDHIGAFRGLTSTSMASMAPPAVQTKENAQGELERLRKQYPSLTFQQTKDLMRAAGWGK